MYDAISFISRLMDVQLPVIRRSKQQLFAGVKVVPPGKVITLPTPKIRGCSSWPEYSWFMGRKSSLTGLKWPNCCTDSQPAAVKRTHGKIKRNKTPRNSRNYDFNINPYTVAPQKDMLNGPEALCNTGHIHQFTHTFIHWWQRLSCKVIRTNLGVSDLLNDISPCSWGSQGFKLATLCLLDDPLHLFWIPESMKTC